MSSPAPSELPRLAATVVLLRDAAAGVEVWLLRRVRAMAFAGGASVFPGGRVDAADFADRGDPLDIDRLGARFGCSPAEARASTMAAIRETFEETGVLLTRPAYDAGVTALQDQRRRVEAHELTFTAVLASLGVTIDTELIRPWTHWITPVGEPRRFDTHFYVAALPVGATAYPETSEASAAEWITPAAALAEHERGARPMLPPTLVTLSELTGFATVTDVLAASDARSLAAVVPELTTVDGVVTARLPDGRSFVLGPARS